MPAPPRVVGRAAVALAVPPLHGLDPEAVADVQAVDPDRLGQGRLWAMGDNVVAGDVEPEGPHVAAEAGDAVQRACLRIVAKFHGPSPFVVIGCAAGISPYPDVGHDHVDAVLAPHLLLSLAE